MVGPSPPVSGPISGPVSSIPAPDTAIIAAKADLRRELRARRKAVVAALDPRIKALLFRRPPRALMEHIAPGQVIGLYLAGPTEPPLAALAMFLIEAGHTVALPWFAAREAPMIFRHWATPLLDETLVPGPWGVNQPPPAADPCTPQVVFVPLVGFDASGGRLGQGGGHYDRWLAAHPGALAIGVAWDEQEVAAIPREAHDRPLAAVLTPTRLLGPF